MWEDSSSYLKSLLRITDCKTMQKLANHYCTWDYSIDFWRSFNHIYAFHPIGFLLFNYAVLNADTENQIEHYYPAIVYYFLPVSISGLSIPWVRHTGDNHTTWKENILLAKCSTVNEIFPQLEIHRLVYFPGDLIIYRKSHTFWRGCWVNYREKRKVYGGICLRRATYSQYIDQGRLPKPGFRRHEAFTW